MGKMLSIVASLTIITSVCGLALGALNSLTAERIQLQILENKQLPAAQEVLQEADNDLLADHQTMELDDGEQLAVFYAKKQGETAPYGVAFQRTSERGFGGALSLLVGFDLDSGNLLGMALTTHEETPGVGARAAEVSPFTEQFRDLSQETEFQVKQDAGPIDALTGATVTSRAVCDAVGQAVQFYQENEQQLRQLGGAAGGDQ